MNKELKSLMDRKAKAEATIKKAVAKTLKDGKAPKAKLRESYLIDFMMGGYSGSLENLDVQWFDSMKALSEGYDMVILRLEENPGYPLFLLSNDSPVASEFEKILKIYLKPYAIVKDKILKDIWFMK